MPLTAEFRIPMVGKPIQSDGAAILWERTRVEITDTDWDNTTFYFEIVAINETAGDVDVDFYSDGSSSVVQTISVPASTTAFTRFRSAAVTLESGTVTYRIQIAAATTAEVRVTQGGLVCVCNNSTKAAPRMLIAAEHDIGTTQGSFIFRTSNATWTDPTHLDNGGSFSLDKNNWGETIVEWGLGFTWRGSAADANGDVRLINETEATVVATHGAKTPGTTVIYDEVTWADSATNWDDGDAFWMEIIKNSGTGFIEISRAEIFVKITSLSKAECIVPLIHSRDSYTADLVMDEWRFLYTAANYGNPIDVIWEFQGRYVSGDSFNCRLVDDGTDDSGAPTSPVISSILIDSGYTDWAITRNSGLSLTDGNRYVGFMDETATADVDLAFVRLILVAIEPSSTHGLFSKLYWRRRRWDEEEVA